MAGGASSLKENGCPDSDMVINFQNETMQNELLKRITFFWHLRKGAMKWFQCPYNQERLALEHRQQLLQEADHERKLANLPQEHSNVVRYVAGKLGALLVILGTRLKRLEQSASVGQ